MSDHIEEPVPKEPTQSTEQSDDKVKSISQDEEGANGEQVVSVDLSLSSLEEKIVRQIEYYFGDRNLPRDKFLQQAIAEGKDGYVSIKTLLTFNRLKSLSSNDEVIAQSLLKASSNLVQVSDDNLSVRRSPDLSLPDIFSIDVRTQIKERSVYIKGFPEETLLDTIQTFLKPFGKVEQVQMRRYPHGDERKFKGSVFVEFDNKVTADEFVTKDLEFEGNKLSIETKEKYLNRKNLERKSKRTSHETPSQEKYVLTANSVLHFNGCGPDASWSALKEALNEYSTVAYVDFTNTERTEGYIRFVDDGGAIVAMEGLSKDDAEPQLLGAPTKVRVVQGTEEIEYWEKKDKAAKMQGKRKGRSSFKHGPRAKHFKTGH